MTQLGNRKNVASEILEENANISSVRSRPEP